MLGKRLSDPQTLGHQYGLGNYTKTYRPFAPGVVFLYLLYLSVLFIGINLIVRIVQFPSSLSLTLSIGPVHGLPLGSVVGGAVCVSLAIIAISRVYISSGLRINIYEHGFIYWNRASTDVVDWRKVKEVFHVSKAYRGGGLLIWLGWEAHDYTISLDDRSTHKFKWIFMSKKLADHFNAQTVTYLFPAAWAAYQAGKPVVFGPITVSQQGIAYGSRIIPWSDIKTLQVSSRLVVKQEGKLWTSLTLVKIPNVEVLRELVLHASGRWLEQPLGTMHIALFLVFEAFIPLTRFVTVYLTGHTLLADYFAGAAIFYTSTGIGSTGYEPFISVIVLFIIVVGVIRLLLAWGLWTLQKWAYWVVVVVFGLDLLLSGTQFLPEGIATEFSLVYITSLIYLLTNNKAKNAFR